MKVERVPPTPQDTIIRISLDESTGAEHLFALCWFAIMSRIDTSGHEPDICGVPIVDIKATAKEIFEGLSEAGISWPK